MKKLMALGFGLLLSVQLFAQGTVYKLGSTTNEYDTVYTGTFQLISLQLVENTGTNTFVRIFDTSGETNTISNPAYKYTLSYSTNLTNTFVDMAGVTNTNVTTVLYSTTLTNAAATNTAVALYQIVVPANSTVLWSPTRPQSFSRGLTLHTTNAAEGTEILYNLLYKPLP